jgi:protein involved in polysaccharide export with SLBB domain
MLRAALLVLSLLALPAVARAATHRISVGDELQISVLGEPNLSSQVEVRSDGTIILPLLNELQVKGLTADQLEKMLRTQLAKFIREPRVHVLILPRHAPGEEFRAQRKDTPHVAAKSLPSNRLCLP